MLLYFGQLEWPLRRGGVINSRTKYSLMTVLRVNQTSYKNTKRVLKIMFFYIIYEDLKIRRKHDYLFHRIRLFKWYENIQTHMSMIDTSKWLISIRIHASILQWTKLQMKPEWKWIFARHKNFGRWKKWSFVLYRCRERVSMSSLEIGRRNLLRSTMYLIVFWWDLRYGSHFPISLLHTRSLKPKIDIILIDNHDGVAILRLPPLHLPQWSQCRSG